MAESKRKNFFWLQLVTRKQIDSALADERPSRLRSQRFRRLLVVALGLMIIAYGVSEVLLGRNKLQSYVEGLLLITSIISYFVLRRSIRLLADAPTELLDERMVAIRDRAYTTAYWCLSVVAGIFVGILLGNDFSLARSQGLTMVICFSLIVGALPAMVLAWTLPSEPGLTDS